MNGKIRQLKENTEKMDLNIFDVIDFRMVSGLIGEALATEISNSDLGFEKNPNIDGYPDLMNASKPIYRNDINKWKTEDFRQFIKFPYGGIEVKNTFGTKKSGVFLLPGQTRIGKINNKLDWKAHHVYTNNLLGLYSDFLDGLPQIVAVMYSDKLTVSDWKEKQNPRGDSTMTSFSVIEMSGWYKLKSGVKFCRNDSSYLKFFGIEG